MERHASELIGKPIITFDTGQRLAHVEDLLVDPERNQVLALLIDNGAVFASEKVIPFGHIKAIGANAILVPQRGVVYEARKDAELRRVFDQRTIKGMRVYSETGDRLGVIGDMIIDDHTGEVLYYEVSGGAVGDAMQGKRTIVPGEVLTMGRLVLYVAAATAARLEAQQGGVTGAQPHLGNLGQQAGASWAQIREEARHLWNQVLHHTNRISDQTDDRLVKARIDRALGRPAARVILDRQDQVILNTGAIITNGAVEQARQAGVLHILLDSVYTERPRLTLDDLKAPWPGRASLEEASAAPAPSGAGGALPPAPPAPDARAASC